MENFLDKILRGSNINPPQRIFNRFQAEFPGGFNPEWFKTEDGYEVVFYLNDVEKIARFSDEGHVVEIKTKCNPDSLPSELKHHLTDQGEIMNVILIEHPKETNYEIIIRDQELTRFALLMDMQGNVLKKNRL